MSAFSCQQGHTSYTAADLPTRNQVSEAAYAASQASAGRLAALTSQVPPPHPPCCFPHHTSCSDPSFPLRSVSQLACYPIHNTPLLDPSHQPPYMLSHALRRWNPCISSPSPAPPPPKESFLTCCSMHHARGTLALIPMRAVPSTTVKHQPHYPAQHLHLPSMHSNCTFLQAWQPSMLDRVARHTVAAVKRPGVVFACS